MDILQEMMINTLYMKSTFFILKSMENIPIQ